jgi:hypothetical protein
MKVKVNFSTNVGTIELKIEVEVVCPQSRSRRRSIDVDVIASCVGCEKCDETTT